MQYAFIGALAPAPSEGLVGVLHFALDSRQLIPFFFIAVACVVVCCSHITLCIPQETPPDGTVSNFCKNGDSGRKSV